MREADSWLMWLVALGEWHMPLHQSLISKIQSMKKKMTLQKKKKFTKIQTKLKYKKQVASIQYW